MAFSNNAYCKIWGITEMHEKYAVVSISSNAKVGDAYVKDFSNKYVMFVGDAFKQIKDVHIPENGIKAKLIKTSVTNCYAKEGQVCYMKNPKFTVFDFEFTEDVLLNSEIKESENEGPESEGGFMNIPDGLDEELPFNV